MKPIIPNKYNIGLWIDKCTPELLEALEPWADNINLTDTPDEILENYINKEQPNTIIPLKNKFNTFKQVDIFIRIKSKTFTNEDYNIIQQLSQILDNNGEVGEFKLGNLFINIKKLKSYTNDLIKL